VLFHDHTDIYGFTQEIMQLLKLLRKIKFKDNVKTIKALKLRKSYRGSEILLMEVELSYPDCYVFSLISAYQK